MDKARSTFCPEKQDEGGAFIQVGSCCTDDEETVIREKFEEKHLTDACSELYKQVHVYPVFVGGRVFVHMKDV